MSNLGPTPGALAVRDAAAGVSTTRQFVRFAFYKLRPEWRLRNSEERAADRRAVVELTRSMEQYPGLVMRTYSLVGTRGDADIMVWLISDQLEHFHEFSARLNQLPIAAYLDEPYSYFAMTKRSTYVEGHEHANGEGRSSRLIILPSGRKYLFVYPFVKTRAWYRLSREDRQRQMTEHIAMGHKYPGVKINTTYSFGLDDQEFVVAFESDSVSDFLDLVQEMRGSEASTHTVRDVPSFTCMLMEPEEAWSAV